jgi:transposase InsO family protein
MTKVMTRQAARMKLMDATIEAGVKVNVTRWCEANGISRRTFYRHRQRIGQEGSWQPRSRRPRTSPGATPPAVVAEIVRLRTALAPASGADAIVAALRELAAAGDWAGKGWRVPHRSTVNKILSRQGLVTPEPRKRPKSSWRRFAYARPRDCYQIDATEVRLADGTAAAVFDVLDDCTRLLAACHAAHAETAAAATTAIRAAASACGAPGIVLCDNGSAFTGGPRTRGANASTFQRAVTALGARLIHSSPYHPQTCGKVERHHQTLKNWLAARPAPATLADLQALLDDYRTWYNTRRHHTAITTTPRQAWDTAPARGGPGHPPRQDDAALHKLTVTANGTIIVNTLKINIGHSRAGQPVTAIRDHDHLTVYTATGEPIGRIHLDYTKPYQGTITPAA